MTQREVLRKILESLNNELHLFNFKVVNKEQGFARNDVSASYYYYVLIYTRTNVITGAKGFLIEPYAGINLHDVEKYYKEITLNKELKSEWDFVTLGNSVANFLANPDGINRKRNESLDLLVFDENDVYKVADKLLDQFKNFALPFFLANNTFEKADKILNKYPFEYCVYSYNDLFRFIKGIIAAKLNNNPATEKLLSIYEKLMAERNMPQDCIEELDRLKSILHMIG